MAYGTALVTLDLAALYLKEGRISEIRDLAVFHSAAVLETATVELTREIAARLERERQRRPQATGA